MTQPVKTNFLNGDVWVRILYMVLFFIALAAARAVICVVALLQTILVLIDGNDNHNLRAFGQSVGKWVYQIVMFLTFNSDDKPFPFTDWPEADETEACQAPQQESFSEPEPEPEPEPEVVTDRDENNAQVDTKGDAKAEDETRQSAGKDARGEADSKTADSAEVNNSDENSEKKPD